MMISSPYWKIKWNCEKNISRFSISPNGDFHDFSLKFLRVLILEKGNLWFEKSIGVPKVNILGAKIQQPNNKTPTYFLQMHEYIPGKNYRLLNSFVYRALCQRKKREKNREAQKMGFHAWHILAKKYCTFSPFHLWSSVNTILVPPPTFSYPQIRKNRSNLQL